MTVYSLGEAFVEFVKKGGGNLATVGEFYGPFPSGAPAITVSAVSRMGGRSRLSAVVGEDEFGKAFSERLRSDGVDVSSLRYTKKRTTGMSFVSYSGDTRTFLFHARDSATALLKPEDVDLTDASVLHVSGSSLAMGWSMAAAVRKAIGEAAKKGVALSFDPNVRPEVMDERTISEIRRYCQRADFLFISEEDAANLFGKLDEGSLKSMSREAGATVVLKRGRRGATVFERGEELRVPAYRVEVVDPTGAGDWFAGSFLAAVESGKDQGWAGRFASAAAAISVTAVSPMDGPRDPQEVVDFMNSHPQAEEENRSPQKG